MVRGFMYLGTHGDGLREKTLRSTHVGAALRRPSD